LGQLSFVVLLTLVSLTRRVVNLSATLFRLDSYITYVDTYINLGKPIQLRWQLLVQHEIVVIVPTERATKKNNKLVRERHDRVLQRMLFFFRCNAHVASSHLANDDTLARWHQ